MATVYSDYTSRCLDEPFFIFFILYVIANYASFKNFFFEKFFFSEAILRNFHVKINSSWIKVEKVSCTTNVISETKYSSHDALKSYVEETICRRLRILETSMYTGF